MKGNQGLEALAALCGGAKRADESRPMRTTASTAPSDLVMTHQRPLAATPRAGDTAQGAAEAAFNSTPLVAAVTTSDQHHVGGSGQPPIHNPPTGSERGPPQGITPFAASQQQQAVDAFQRQWQQAMAAAAAYSAVPSPAAASAAAAFLSAATGGAIATIAPVPAPAAQPQQQMLAQAPSQPAPQAAQTQTQPQSQPQPQTQPQSQQPSTPTVVAAGGDGALQQLAYYQYIQAHAAAAAQAAHAVQLSQQPSPSTPQLQQVYHQSSNQETKNEGAPAPADSTLASPRATYNTAPPPVPSVQQTTNNGRPIHRESPNHQAETPLQQALHHQLHHDPQKTSQEQGNGARIMGPPVIPQAPPGQQLSQPRAQAPIQGTMQPPPPVPQSISPSCPNSAPSHVRVAPTPTSAAVVAAPLPIAAATPLVQMRDAKVEETVSSSSDHASQATSDDGSTPLENKKQLKRAANRRSAQLSRKRKKQFIEELKDENDELRRKEQILRSIPDLIVVFDSAGRLWFVSDSVTRFLDFTPQELDGSSFWERLCDESVRLLKAAFMDALAARQKDSDTAPLGSGVWELRLVDKDGSHKAVTLNGVVHFSGEAPECVCSIRPCEDVNLSLEPKQVPRPSFVGGAKMYQPGSEEAAVSQFTAPVGDGNGSLLQYQKPNQTLTAISPQQSFTSNASSDDATVKSSGRAIAAPAGGNGAEGGANMPQHGSRRTIGRVAAQISDGDSVSESGSDE